MSLIEPNLFLGDYATLQKYDFLRKNQIQIVIDLIQYYPTLNPVPLPPWIHRYSFPMPDRVDIDPLVNFELIREVLDTNLPHRCVYVHCEQGISRAPTIVAAYLMQKHKWTVKQALEFIRSKRPQINPNPGFRKYLAAHEILLFDNPEN
jgi:protein-tyrosine phosphatase